MRRISVVLMCSFLAIACRERGDVRTTAGTEPAPTEQTRNDVVGIVDGGPWMGGGPPRHPTWRVIAALDERYDIAPVDLERGIPQGVGLLLVPLLSSLTQPQLDRLRVAIDGGMPAIVIADPFPLVDMRLLPSEPLVDENAPTDFGGSTELPPPKGDAVGFLAVLGIAWRDDRVLVGREPLGLAPDEVVVADVATPLRGPLVLAWSGALAPMGGTRLDELVTTRRSAFSRPSEEYIALHPLFGPQLVPQIETVAPSERATDRPSAVVIATRPRGELLVVADLDVFSDQFFKHELALAGSREETTKMSIGNASLLDALVARTLRAGHASIPPTAGTPVLERAAIEHIVEIDVVTRTELPPVPSDTEQGPPAPIVEWLRLGKHPDGWRVQTRTSVRADDLRVDALLAALANARWESPPAGAASLDDPSTIATSKAVRVVARDARGETVVDVLLALDGEHRAARATFDAQLRGMKVADMPPLTASSFTRR